MIEDITTLSYSLYHNKGIYALFLGSGISRPAGIMTGWEIIVDQIGQLALLTGGNIEGSAEAWYRAKYQKEPDYSDILEAVTRTSEERVNALKKYFEPDEEEQENKMKLPTIAHHQIARLVKGGFVKVIITTNFDRLLENALKAQNIEAVVISNPNQVENVQPLIHSPVTIIKINGDYLDTKFLNIKTELSGYDARLEKILADIFENFGLITSGWSAAWDVAIVDQLKSSNKFRYGNYFTYRGKPTKELEDLSKFRKGVLLPVQDADAFFRTLADDMEAMEELHTRHPITKSLTIAKLKKYIVKSEGRIQLHDLVMQEANALFDLNKQRVFIIEPGSALKNEFTIFNTQSQILASLLVNGIYWDEGNNQELWLRALSKFLYTNELEPTSAIRWKFRNYPPLYLFYSMGISAILTGNFGLLAKLLHFKIYSKDDRADVYIIKFLNNYNLFEKSQLQATLSNKDDQPMSRYLLTELKPYYKDFVAHERDYEDAFDYFEYALTLIYVTVLPREHVWMPLGYFAQKLNDSYFKKGSIITKKRMEAQKLEDKFELAQETLFKDYAAFHEADLKFVDWTKGMHFM